MPQTAQVVHDVHVPRVGMAGRARAAVVRIAIVAPSDSPALRALPTEAGAKFIVGNSLVDFEPTALAEVDALLYVPPGDRTILSAVFDAAPKCAWVHCFFAGVDSLSDFTAERLVDGRGVAVPLTNGRGAFSASLAEFSLAAMLHYNKQLRRCAANLEAKRWDKFEMDVLAGKTVAYLGWGHIARTSARLAKAFGMRTIALRRDASRTDPLCDEMRSSQSAQAKRATFAEADFVVSALPGTPETIDFVGAAELDAMKPSSVFISLGRGLVVDEMALGDALRAGSIAGAALDVFKVEPLPSTSPLWGISPERLLLTAHNADYTADYFELGWSVFQQNLDAFRAGAAIDGMATPVDKHKGY